MHTSAVLGSPMAELVAHEALGAPLGGRQLCASIVEMSVPKLLGIKRSLVEKWGRVFSILGPNDVKNELRHLFQESQGELRQATRLQSDSDEMAVVGREYIL